MHCYSMHPWLLTHVQSQPVQNQKRDKISEKAGFLVENRDILKNSMKTIKIFKLRDKLVHKNIVKKAGQSEEKAGQQ